MTSRMEFRNYRSSAQLVHCNIHQKRYSDVPPKRSCGKARDGHCSGRYASYWNAFLLPPATKLGQGYVFTGVCDSVNRGRVPYTPPEQTPSGTRHPPSPQSRRPPGPDPLTRHPPRTRHPPLIKAIFPCQNLSTPYPKIGRLHFGVLETPELLWS